MIIPEIKTSPDLQAAGLIEQLSDWSLLGQVAVTNVTADHLEPLEQALKRVGGMVDVLFELTEFNETSALTLLNAGACKLLCRNPDQDFGAIPDDRVSLLKEDSSPDDAIPSGCILIAPDPSVEQLAERLAELEMARFDCLADAEHLTPDVLIEFFKLILVTDREDGLWSTVIVDPLGIALGLAYSNEESLHYAIEHRVGTYWSRSRKGLWIKGETSGATQQLLNIRLDCDRDCLRFMVTQDPPGFCHRDTHSCFGEERTIQSVMERLLGRMGEPDEQSFTRKLANDPAMLETKLLEEAKELSEASQTNDLDEIAWEAADVLYFSFVAMLKNGVPLDRVYHELARRMNRVVRRKNKLEAPESTN